LKRNKDEPSSTCDSSANYVAQFIDDTNGEQYLHVSVVARRHDAKTTDDCEKQHTDWTYELLADAVCSVIA
jgi:hypothetical protein